MISVIVPICNVEKYLPTCIESIINQTYKDIEILLIDDGSTDNSGRICDEYAKQDSRCIVIHQTNQGVSQARNTGLKHVTGEYISFIDGDDYIHPQMFEILYNEIKKGKFDFAMVSHYTTSNNNITTTKIEKFSPLILNRTTLMQGLYNKTNLSELDFQVVWNKLYKRTLFADVRFKTTGTEDTEFNNRIYLKTKAAIFINLPLYYWVQRSNSITHQPVNQNFIDRAYSYLLCLHEIPAEISLYRAFCLEKLYKTIINVRYRSKNTEWHNYAISQTSILKQATIKEFILNKHIPLIKKIGLLLFLYIPYIYSFFMYLNEFMYKLRK